MLTLLASLAFAQSLPLPDVNPQPTRPPSIREVGQGAHWTAEAGRWTALGGAGLAVGSLVPATLCAIGGNGDLGCGLSFVGVGVGAGGVVAGLTMQGVGSYSYLRKHGQSRGTAATVGKFLVLGGAAGILTGTILSNPAAPLALLGSSAVVAGVVVLDVQHVRVRRGQRVAFTPVFDPVNRAIGVSGRF